MGAWATASLFIVSSILWMEGEADPQLFQPNHQDHPGLSRQQFYFRRAAVPVLQSASDVQYPSRLRSTSTNYPIRNVRYDQNFPLVNSHFFKTFNENFEKNLEKTRPQTFSEHDRTGLGDNALTDSYGDHKTAESTHFLGPQIETIHTDHYHEKVPAFDVGEFHHEHHGKEKHGEVHYHQHKHVHNHEHKQEHVHQHKQEHDHKHLHHQQHKHDHHQEHKHGHQHKHDHHQDHKHDHHHDHKEDAHHEHKHGHHHGHKHQHHSENKHQHKHGHKHGYKHSKYH